MCQDFPYHITCFLSGKSARKHVLRLSARLILFFIGGFVTTSTTKRADLDLDKYMVT